jgi:ABC-2 type transport system permease protein
VWGLRNSSYFDIVREPKNEAEIQRMLAQGTVQFAVEIPVDFSRELLRGGRPDLLLASKFLFNVPIVGSVPLLLALTFLFIVANLAVGITFSTIAKNQLQAVQMAFFFFLPSLLLSGYMFPFRGMPGWAQDIGELLPLTHFLRVVRGILLKGNGLAEIAPDLWPIALFLVMILAIGIKRYRQTLD